MPRVKSVMSLTRICNNFILENQEIYCVKCNLVEELGNSGDALDSDKLMINRFDELPMELLEELLRLLRKSNRDWSGDIEKTKTYRITPLLKMLMTPRLRTLDLTVIKRECNCIDISDVVHLAKMRCPNLETLRLDYSTRQHLKYADLIPKFVKLRILDIESDFQLPEIGDYYFEIIGKHCPDLRELYWGYGAKLTDDGIRKLCVDGNCKSIRFLSLRSCKKVTTKGIQIALENLPLLCGLLHECLLECLAEIAQNAVNHKLSLPKYSLTTLYMLDYTVYKSGSLRQSVLLCPNVTKMDINMIYKKRLEKTDLLSLLSLEKLYTLEIANAQLEYSYDARRDIRIDRLPFVDVVPLLKKFGCYLKKLYFEGFFDFDISAILELCPNLEYLSINKCRANQSTEISKIERPILQNLKKLSIHNPTISSENLFALLSSPALSHIYLFGCDVLTDNALQRLADLHSFRNLEYLNLYGCNSITKNGIEIFLQEFNPLNKIVLYFNRGITRQNIIDWNDNAIWIKKNWELKFIFCCCYIHPAVCLGGAKIAWGNTCAF